MNGIVAQLISMFSMGLSDALWRKPIGKLVVEEAIIYRTVFSLLFFFVLLFLDLNKTTELAQGVLGFNIWFFTFLVCCISYFGLFFFNKALKHSSTGLVVIVTTSSYLFGQLTSFILLGETPKKGYILPFALFILSIIVSDYSSIFKFKLSKGVWFALLASLFWGVTLPLLSIPAKQIGYVKTGFISELSVMLMSLFGLFFLQKKNKEEENGYGKTEQGERRSVQKERKIADGNSFSLKYYHMRLLDIKFGDRKLSISRFKTDLIYFVFLGLLSGIGVLFNNLSYTKIPVYIASSISSSTHLVTIVLAWILFKEKLKVHQYIAALISVVAIYLLTQIY